jgi:hypothetical protein
VAGFFALFSIADGSPWSSPDQLALSVPKERVTAVLLQADARLERAGIDATVGTITGWVATGTGDGGEHQVTATVADPDRLDAAIRRPGPRERGEPPAVARGGENRGSAPGLKVPLRSTGQPAWTRSS